MWRGFILELLFRRNKGLEVLSEGERLEGLVDEEGSICIICPRYENDCLSVLWVIFAIINNDT